MQQHANHVVEVNPRHVLPAPRDRATQAQAKERKHRLERTAIGREHHSRAGQEHPREVPGRDCLPFPIHDHARQEVLSRPGVLVDRLIASGTVVADRGLRDQSAGSLRGRQGAQPGDERAGPPHPRIADPALDLLAPALRERLTHQVDHRIGTADRLR